MTASDPAKLAEDARLLLATGRPAMALRLFDDLPAAIQAAMTAEREKAASEALASQRSALGTLGSARRMIAAAETRLAELKAETRRDEAEHRDLGARIANRRAELASLAEAVTRKRRELARLRAPRPAPAPAPKPYQVLAAALAEGRITTERVATLLRIGPRDVERIASGTVGLASGAWQRVLRELPR